MIEPTRAVLLIFFTMLPFLMAGLICDAKLVLMNNAIKFMPCSA